MKYFGKRISDLKNDLETAARYNLNTYLNSILKTIAYNYLKRNFENMAIDVLKIFEKNTTEMVEDVLIVRFLEDFGMDCIELAIICKCENFISHTTVQNIFGMVKIFIN